MKEKKILSRTNPYLRNRAKRQKALFKSVCSSSAIEGIDARELLSEYATKEGQIICRKPGTFDFEKYFC